MSDNWNYEQNYLPHVLATVEVRNERIEICKQCDKITELKFCSECNCFMPAKTWLKTKECPLKKW